MEGGGAGEGRRRGIICFSNNWVEARCGLFFIFGKIKEKNSESLSCEESMKTWVCFQRWVVGGWVGEELLLLVAALSNLKQMCSEMFFKRSKWLFGDPRVGEESCCGTVHLWGDHGPLSSDAWQPVCRMVGGPAVHAGFVPFLASHQLFFSFALLICEMGMARISSFQGP